MAFVTTSRMMHISANFNTRIATMPMAVINCITSALKFIFADNLLKLLFLIAADSS